MILSWIFSKGAVFALYLSVVLLILSIGGCGGTKRWREEVVQPDGSMIIVDRWVYLGGNFDRDPVEWGLHLPTRGYGLKIPLPRGKIAEWDEDRGLTPMIAVVKDGQAYVALLFSTCVAYWRYERPTPPYVVMKYEEQTWRRITVDEFPSTNANLLISVDAATDAGRVTAELVDGWNRHVPPDYRALQRSPPWSIVRTCA